jgi:hypothetical protein
MLDPQICPSMDIDMIMDTDTDTETDIQYTPRTHTYTQNGTNGKYGKRQFLIVCCKQKAETANFRLFAANENRKRKFVSLGRQTINGNRILLF